MSTTNPTERWVPVKGYEGRYEVSSAGRVRSLQRQIRGRYDNLRTLVGRVMSPASGTRHYPKVFLYRGDGTSQGRLVHRLVAAAFIGECPPGYTVNHIDGVKTNNAVENLEYLTNAENISHGHRTGLITPPPPLFGASNPNTVLNTTKAAIIKRRLLDGEKCGPLAREFGVGHAAIWRIQKGHTWRDVQPAPKNGACGVRDHYAHVSAVLGREVTSLGALSADDVRAVRAALPAPAEVSRG